MVNDKIADIAFKCRGLFWTLLAVCLLVFPIHFSWQRYVAGFLFIIVGQALRFWAAGYIPKYRTVTVGAPELVTSGPYSIVRNPLYCGNFLLGLGWAVMAGFNWVAFFCIAFFLLYCLIIIPAEEKFLEGKFGDAYIEYKQTTNALIPSFNCHVKEDENRKFDLKKAFSEEKYSMRMHLLVTILLTAKFWFIR